VQAKKRPLDYAATVLSVVALGVGSLLFLERWRPFRDFTIDGPIAVSCAVAGTILAAWSVKQRKGNLVLGILALTLNIIALFAVAVVFLILSRPMRLF
jgi:hypothetical protein